MIINQSLSMENTDERKLIKVVLIGEVGVGKSSIISSFLNKPFSSVQLSTMGASFAAKTLYIEEEKKYIKFDIWDTAGQERFRTMIKGFYKTASVAIMIYDITRVQSFEQLKQYWYHEIKENSSEDISKSICIFTYIIVYALVGNKNDMYYNEQIDESIGQKYAKDIGAIFKLTSAKLGHGIQDLFIQIGKQYLKDNKLGFINDGTKSEKLDKNVNLKLKSKRDCC